MRQATPGRAGASFEIVFEGERLAAIAGETIAATLLAHGRLHLSTDKQGRPRGVYCGMGVCHDCLVKVDGRPGERACLTAAEPDQRVERMGEARLRLTPDLADLAPPPSGDPPTRTLDVLIVGAGPAGLSAAVAARSFGAEVLVIDERPSPGGQFYKQRARSRPRDAQAREGRALIDKARGLGVAFEPETLVWGAARDGAGGVEVFAYSKQRTETLKPRVLIVATGAYERPAMLRGWTLPGVMTTGAAQTLARSYGVAPGRDVLLAGNGPLNLQVAAELADLGRRVTVVEAAEPPWSRPMAGLRLAAADLRLAIGGLTLIARLRRAGVKILWGHRLTAVEGEGKAQRAIVAPLGAGGVPDLGRAFSVDVDCVLAGDGFQPADELPRLLGRRAGDPGAERPDLSEDVLVVGEAAGFAGAHVALAEGELAGREAARRLGRDVPDAPAARRSLARCRRFQSALWDLFAARPAELAAQPGETLVCRCEGVALATLREAIAQCDVRDLATLKRLTRAGMGRCQGRYCAPALGALIGAGAAAEFAPQMPLRPVPLAALAVEKPEWRGHRRALAPPTPVASAEPLDVGEIDTVVIGAGIVGLSTALYLARAGRPCLVLDQAYPNSGASGGNAGSLHAQLLSFDFGGAAGAGAALSALPFQLESIRLWETLQAELAQDFELKITGGLMLAESEDDLAFLEAKTAAERAQGVACRVIGRADLRALEPALDDRFLGAAHCPQEGKINPLLATQAVLDAARAAGALVRPMTSVVRLERTAEGYVVATSRGAVRARRVVNAAGGFAARIGDMLGLRVPVFGAPLQMIVTEPAAPTLSSLVAQAGRHLTLKQAANGAFLIGGGWAAELDPVHRRPRPSRASLEGNLWVAQHAMPGLRKLRVLRSWGAINIDIDGAPVVGEHPDAPGFYNAVTSNGYTLGPIMGKTTAELILAGRAERDISAFAIARFGAGKEARHD